MLKELFTSLFGYVGGAYALWYYISERTIFKKSYHELLEISELNRIRPKVFLDVGAHIGEYTLIAAKFARRVIAVEPDPRTFTILKLKTKHLKKCGLC